MSQVGKILSNGIFHSFRINQIVQSISESILSIKSFDMNFSGDYCWEPLVNCDTANTVLYCVKGRCACPTDWTLAPGNLPLNTVWHPSYKRCVSLIGSGCHMSPTNSAQGYVYCQPGVECVPHSTYSEVGICGKASSSLSTSYSLIFSCLMCIFTALKLSGVVKTEYTSFY